MQKTRLRTKNVGSPWEIFSDVSGSARQICRTRAIWALPALGFLANFFFVAFFFDGVIKPNLTTDPRQAGTGEHGLSGFARIRKDWMILRPLYRALYSVIRK